MFTTFATLAAAQRRAASYSLVAMAIMLLAAVSGRAASLTFTGNKLPVITHQPPASTGLEAVYVLYNTEGVKASWKAASAQSKVRWYRFSNLGGGYAQEIMSAHSGAESTITVDEDDIGYIIEEDGRQTCFWVVNYANHMLNLFTLEIAAEQDCDRTALLFSGDAEKITYYSINGVAQTLSRQMKVSYNTLVYDKDSHSWQPTRAEATFDGITTTLRVESPLCNTVFTLSGDAFLEQWGMPQSITSAEYLTNAVSAETTSTQLTTASDNEQRVEATLGGSGPVDITFDAAVTDAVVYKEWQFARDAQFDVIDLRFQDLEVTRTFSDYGTTYVRFVCGDNAGSCSWTSETYEVYIGESSLECPNAFSPNGDGVNDCWCVSYKSIVEFDCHIFNRLGLEMAHLTDPSQRWDGRYGGKTVPAGVYYYVIKALGADGKKYKLSGDINIVKVSEGSKR